MNPEEATAALECEKTRLRRATARRRRSLAPSVTETAGRRLLPRALRLARETPPGLAACFLAMAGEPPTRDLIAALEADGWTVCVPAWNPESGRYHFARWHAGMAAVAGPAGVPQPAAPEWVDAARMGLVFVPGVAFDRAGGRVGHGGGHYDRLLATCDRRLARFIGLAFDFQICETAPMTDRDIRMDAVLYETTNERDETDPRGSPAGPITATERRLP